MNLSEKKLCARHFTELIPIFDNIINLGSRERILHQIVDKIVRHLECQTCAVVQINPETELLEILNFHNLSWKFCKDYRKKIVSPILRELIWKGNPINIPNRSFASTFADELKMENDFVSCFAVQLAASHQPLGFLYLDSVKEGFFEEEQRILVEFYARMISSCIFLDRLSEKLKRLQHEDVDSGAVKFEQFFPKLQDIFHRSYRMKENTSAILFDIEGYASLIKLYGMDVTRTLLKEFVKLLKANLRPYDEISRFGADEFLVILPGTKKIVAVSVAEKFNALIKKAEFTDQKIKISVFAGVVGYPENCKSAKGLITACKNALYEAKRTHVENKIAIIDEVFD
jgi:diguanylate cyclase (GGDEF)-like protein